MQDSERREFDQFHLSLSLPLFLSEAYGYACISACVKLIVVVFLSYANKEKESYASQVGYLPP